MSLMNIAFGGNMENEIAHYMVTDEASIFYLYEFEGLPISLNGKEYVKVKGTDSADIPHIFKKEDCQEV